MGVIINAHDNSTGKLETKSPLRRPSVDGSITLEWILGT